MKNKEPHHDKGNIKPVFTEQVMGIDKVVSRSFMKKLSSLSGLGLVREGAVSGATFRRALRNNDKEIRIDNKRPR